MRISITYETNGLASDEEEVFTVIRRLERTLKHGLGVEVKVEGDGLGARYYEVHPDHVVPLPRRD